MYEQTEYEACLEDMLNEIAEEDYQRYVMGRCPNCGGLVVDGVCIDCSGVDDFE